VNLSPELVTTAQSIAALLGAAYVVLAARRNRLCWLAGALSAALVGVLSAIGGLPRQGAHNAYYVGMSIYGYWSWTRTSQQDELPVGTLPLRWHLLAAVVIVPISWFTAGLLARETQAAWPLLDSLTTWFSLFATWLVARARIENWLYWIVIDGVLVYLYYMQDMHVLALQFLALTVLAVAGLVAWRRKLSAQQVAA
jgi:nicotinamide mononucleotide transporter